MDFSIYAILRILPMITGAVEIGWAINNYERKNYFLFGFWIMAALGNVIQIAKVIMEG